MVQGIADGNAAVAPPRAGVVTLSIKSRAELFQAWMPFLAGGGLFIPTNRAYSLGEEVFVLLGEMNTPEKLTLRGTVAWINPAHMHDGRPQGIGVSLQGDPGAADLRKRIEQMLGTAAHSSRPTFTI
jgi:type IV pilus assembly protein PilZ